MSAGKNVVAHVCVRGEVAWTPICVGPIGARARV
ncbi:hypothetical protein COLO4_28556 [Corchorus olitorius]|uniref:Uncharacterized protein n=1 Tax=Corchorus olitorius TaxID=93759 RepID=A0A1R3HJT7_9ROSI|nr:hypothetical protein COLO4_28556 [Corchorus olitorius]